MSVTSRQSTGQQANVEERSGKLRVLNVVVGLVHLAQGVGMLLLSNDLALPVFGSFLSGDPVEQTGAAPPEQLFTLPIGITVAVFLFFAAADHLLMATPGIASWYERNLGRGVNYARWIEYSFSASIMLVLIAMFAGIWEFAALLAFFGVNSSMILFGLLMERHQTPGNPDWSAFIYGTLAGLVPWVAIAYYLSQADGAPGFVYGIFVSLFVFFMSFGVNQWLQYREVGKWRDYVFGEQAYIVLSLAAKSALAWQIFGNVLRS